MTIRIDSNFDLQLAPGIAFKRAVRIDRNATRADKYAA